MGPSWKIISAAAAVSAFVLVASFYLLRHSEVTSMNCDATLAALKTDLNQSERERLRMHLRDCMRAGVVAYRNVAAYFE